MYISAAPQQASKSYLKQNLRRASNKLISLRFLSEKAGAVSNDVSNASRYLQPCRNICASKWKNLCDQGCFYADRCTKTMPASRSATRLITTRRMPRNVKQSNIDKGEQSRRIAFRNYAEKNRHACKSRQWRQPELIVIHNESAGKTLCPMRMASAQKCGKYYAS